MNNQPELFNLAVAAAAKAYAPYSHFAVGAAILSNSDRFYSGCNVENASYPIGTCAEESAIAAMVNGGDRLIRQILIYSTGSTLISPCGACRQRIAEFADETTQILLANPNGIQQTFSIAEMLPFHFAEF